MAVLDRRALHPGNQQRLRQGRSSDGLAPGLGVRLLAAGVGEPSRGCGQILLTIDDGEAQARLSEQQALVDVRQADVARAETELSRQQAQMTKPRRNCPPRR